MMTTVPKPLPELTPLTRPFLEAAQRAELRLQKCKDCHHIRFPVGPVCTNCLSDRFEWARMCGHGTVLAHLVFHRAYHPGWAEDVPYSVILVQLREGPRMFSNLVDPDRRYIDQDLVGRHVSVVFDEIGEGLSLPRFAVSPSPPANDDPAAE